MPLNFKKVTTRDAIRGIEEKIAFHKKSVAWLKGLSKSGNKKELLEWLHQRSIILQKAINDNLGNPNHVRLLRAVSFAGELRGLKNTINLFEDVEVITLPDQQQIELWSQQLKSLRELPTRKDE